MCTAKRVEFEAGQQLLHFLSAQAKERILKGSGRGCSAALRHHCRVEAEWHNGGGSPSSVVRTQMSALKKKTQKES